MDTLLIAAYGDIKTAKTTFGLSFPKPLVVFDLDQSYIRASMRYMAANPGLRSKIVTQVDRLQPHHLKDADIIVIQYKIPLNMPGKPREGLLDLWENQIIPDMIQVHESDIASVMVDTGTILWEIDHQAHLERVQKEALAREKKPRESLIQIEYARPNKEIRAIYQMARATGKNLVSVNHLGAKYGVGLVEERRGGRSEKVMKSDVVIGESWRGFSQLGQIVDLVLRTRLEYNCTKCQMWIPVAPNNTVPIEIEAVHGKCKSYINMTPTPTGEIEECGYVLDAQGLKLPNPNYDSVKLSIRAMMGAL